MIYKFLILIGLAFICCRLYVKLEGFKEFEDEKQDPGTDYQALLQEVRKEGIRPENWMSSSSFPFRERVQLEKFPYREDIEPRLVDYLRKVDWSIKNGIKPILPLEHQYFIKNEDLPRIDAYLQKYNIPLSTNRCFVDRLYINCPEVKCTGKIMHEEGRCDLDY